MTKSLQRMLAVAVVAASVAAGSSSASAANQASHRAHMAPQSPMGLCMDGGGTLLQCWYWATFLR